MYYCDMVVSTIFITSVLCGAKHINRSGICIEHLNFVSYVCRYTFKSFTGCNKG